MTTEYEHDSVSWYLETAAAHRVLSAHEEQALGRRIQAGDVEAAQELARHNVKLVVSIAKRYVGMGLPLADLIQEGNLGLLAAMQKFDPARGLKFSTMATWWIRQRIERSLHEAGAHAIRLPIHLTESLRKLRKTAARLTLELDRDPSDQELADALGVPLSRLQGWQLADQRRQVAQLDAPCGGDSASSDTDERIAFLIDQSIDIPASVESSDQRAILFRHLDTLPERDRCILIHRYGLDDAKPETLEQVGLRLGLTRERVRQLEREALKRLAGVPAIQALRGAA